jgi:hypothetical protein
MITHIPADIQGLIQKPVWERFEEGEEALWIRF